VQVVVHRDEVETQILGVPGARHGIGPRRRRRRNVQSEEHREITTPSLRNICGAKHIRHFLVRANIAVYPPAVRRSLTETEMEAWQALLHAHEHVTRILDSELRTEHSLTWSEYDVLVRLARAPQRSLRMTELAQRVMMSPSGLTRVVDRLAEGGLVDRRRDPEDARVVHARLTEEGRDLVRKAARTHVRGIRQHFTGRLSEPQLRDVASALGVIAGPHEPH